ncbi:MAG TPA: rhamnulokinase family protein [Microbacteriaceae bacterium]
MVGLFGAVDIGASSGRVIAGMFEDGYLRQTEIHRFDNGPVEKPSGLFWDFENLFSEVVIGLEKLADFARERETQIESIGIDTWAVDFGVIREGKLLREPHCYRDPRNSIGVEAAEKVLSPEEMYEFNGLQFLPFNTVYQILKIEQTDEFKLGPSDQLLLIPDLIGYLLTGELATERTNASSTGLLNPRNQEFSVELMQTLGLRQDLFPQLRSAGSILGKVKGEASEALAGVDVVLVGSHDTASSVVGVPATEHNFAFISSGTWSLLGAEIPKAIVSEQSRAENFTNELGVDNRIRFLKNLSGLWLLSESLRHWSSKGEVVSLPSVLEEAAEISPSVLFDVTDASLIEPGDMPSRIQRLLASEGLEKTLSKAEIVATILHSLATSYSSAFENLKKLTGTQYETIYFTGGGSQNRLLTQLTADYCGVDVVAGPVEATAIGNLLVQIRSATDEFESLEDIRGIVRASFTTEKYQPRQRVQ